MAKRMLIDASHPEETRVAVITGNRLEDFDYESASRKQLKGNIYLAKVTRVEPSLQAAFVDYGGNRHGFLPFSEIHPDYYRIPIADREALIAAEAEATTEPLDGPDEGEDGQEGNGAEPGPEAEADEGLADAKGAEDETAEENGAPEYAASAEGLEPETAVAEAEDGPAPEDQADEAEEAEDAEAPDLEAADLEAADLEAAEGSEPAEEEPQEETPLDTLGGDEVEDAARRRAKLLRRYKIQEVIKRRQVILVQVTKEERGNKGAALTTYLSLAGRYCVLMPNTAKGGGISRKIANAKDRRRLKRILEDLKIPDGIGVIVRTAGSERTKAEIRRDYEFLLRLWDEIRSTTLNSTAPALIYEEANLIKRAIRDLYQSNTDEILVEGDEGYKAAKAFMKSLTPSHARKVKLFKDSGTPLFFRHQIENQIDEMHNSVVQLRSGGYIVIHMTEALVAIDVNSGKATRERHIEETAYKTNLEAADEVARQLRLRDLAGLIVIDFIDMDESRHNRAVERRLKEAMRHDRARIQLGRISPFGLLEMSRQRLRPSLLESSTEACPYCNASGYIRTTQSVALHVLRGLEEEGIRRGGGEITVTTPRNTLLHLLNQMRDRLVGVEQRYGLRVWINEDDSLIPPNYILQRGAGTPAETAAEARAEEEDRAEERTGDRGERKRGRTRRRRRKTAAASAEPAEAAQALEAAEAEGEDAEEAHAASEAGGEESGEERPRRRRRGKRGGRRRSRRQGAEGAEAPNDAEAEAAENRAETESEQAAEAESQVTGAEASESPEEAPPPKRRSRRRSGSRRAKDTPAEATEATQVTETTAENGAGSTESVEAEPATAAAPDGEEDTAAPTTRVPLPESDSDDGQDTGDGDALAAAAPGPHGEVPGGEIPGAVNGEDEASSEPKPKRRGWWNRWS